MKLWQGWHNTDQDRPNFHYGPLRVQSTDGDTVTKTCKRNVKWEMKKPSGSFLSNSREICRHFIFLVHRETVS